MRVAKCSAEWLEILEEIHPVLADHEGQFRIAHTTMLGRVRGWVTDTDEESWTEDVDDAMLHGWSASIQLVAALTDFRVCFQIFPSSADISHLIYDITDTPNGRISKQEAKYGSVIQDYQALKELAHG